jgi:hypothetical protein
MDQSQQKQIGPYKGGRMSGWARGMDNQLSNIDIPADILRNAVNVDVLSSGKVRRRRGISRVVSDIGAHSLFSDKVRMLWATANALKSCTANFAVTTLLTDVRLANPLSFVVLNGEVYFTNEGINGKVNALGAYEAWGTSPPAVSPACISLDSGDKPIQYQVTCTFVMASGEESGAPVATTVLGGTAGVISLSNIPQSTDSRVAYTRVYVSDKDGDMFYAQVDVPTGLTTYIVRGPYGVGKKLMTQHMRNLPSGQLIEYYNGRLYVAVGNLVLFTEALRYGLYNPTMHYYMFPERVTLLKAVDDGLYISSDITYFIGGDPKMHSKGGATPTDLTPLLPYKAIEGAACDLSYTHDVMWLSERGFIIGSSGGKFKNLTEDRIAMDDAARGCMGMLETNGLKSVIAIMRESNANPLASSDYVVAEAERIAEAK